MVTKNGNGKKNGNGHAGHPPIVIDWVLISKLAQIQCTMDEIAFVCKCSSHTLYNHCTRTQGCTFEDFLENNRQGGKASLRRAQFDQALGREGELLKDDKGKIVTDDKGRPQWKIQPIASNPTMQIWLGKQYLGQADKQEIAGRNGEELVLKVKYDNSDKGSNNTPA